MKITVFSFIFICFLHYSYAHIHYQLKTFRGKGSGLAEFWTCYYGYYPFNWQYPKTGFYGTIPATQAWGIYFNQLCDYPPAIGTILSCTAEYLKNDNKAVDKVCHYLASQCKLYSDFNHPWDFYSDQLINATDYLIPLHEIHNISVPLTYPIILDRSQLHDYYIGNKNYYFNIDCGLWFSVSIYAFFGLVFVLTFVFHAARSSQIFHRFNKYRIVKLLNSFFILPTLSQNEQYKKTWNSITSLFPNRAIFLIDFLIFSLQIVYYSVNYFASQGKFYDSISSSKKRFIADRTGIMALGKLPLIIFCSIRSNFLMYITGLPHSIFLHFHKVLSYWLFFDAFIHSISYTLLLAKFYKNTLRETYFACGIASMTLIGLIIFQSLLVFRRHFYEYFKIIHIIFSLCFLIMIWFHCNVMGWCEWIMAGSSIWCLDFIIRVIRIISFGYRPATLTIVDERLIKCEISKPSWWFHQPGQFGYIYFKNVIFWENHPFTLINDQNKLVVFIKVKKGITLRLWNILINNRGVYKCKVSIEGPYGGENTNKIKKMDNKLMIAGGLGITDIIDSVLLIKQGRLLWIVPHLTMVAAFIEQIKQIDIGIDLFITQNDGQANTYNKTEFIELLKREYFGADDDNFIEPKSVLSSVSDTVKFLKNNITITFRRPDFNSYINHFVNSRNSENIGIICCGPRRMVDHIRDVTSESILRWNKSVDFYDKSQTW